MPPLEAWKKVYLSNEAFFESVHASLGCTACHGGNSEASSGDIETAHEGVVRDPDPEQVCKMCHAENVETFKQNSLHWGLDGFLAALQERSSEEHWPQVTEAFDKHCAGCHTSCGQCHVSRPASTGGGLLDGHNFKKTPPPYTTCTGCHGSRIENEYKGRNEDEDGKRYPADVHYNPGGMHCHNCHSADEMHGETGESSHRYQGMVIPSCTNEGCHPGVGSEDENEQHTEAHLERLSCQVCHSMTYKNCYNCHVQKSEDGVPFFKTGESQLLFRIGQNALQSDNRPWEYVPVRHVPVARDSFAYYGEDLLPNFDSRPTWTYATPHNTQRVTPQNESCQACHGNSDVFLTPDDVDPDEQVANAAIIVKDVPPVPGAEAKPTAEPTEEPPAVPTTESLVEPTEEPPAAPTVEPTQQPAASAAGSNAIWIGIVAIIVIVGTIAVVMMRKK